MNRKPWRKRLRNHYAMYRKHIHLSKIEAMKAAIRLMWSL